MPAPRTRAIRLARAGSRATISDSMPLRLQVGGEHLGAARLVARRIGRVRADQVARELHDLVEEALSEPGGQQGVHPSKATRQSPAGTPQRAPAGACRGEPRC